MEEPRAISGSKEIGAAEISTRTVATFVVSSANNSREGMEANAVTAAPSCRNFRREIPLFPMVKQQSITERLCGGRHSFARESAPVLASLPEVGNVLRG